MHPSGQGDGGAVDGDGGVDVQRGEVVRGEGRHARLVHGGECVWVGGGLRQCGCECVWVGGGLRQCGCGCGREGAALVRGYG